MKRTEKKTKERQMAETTYLSSPDPSEGAACLAQALSEQGIPEAAAAKAASAFGDSLRVTQAAWRKCDASDSPFEGDDDTAQNALTPEEKNLLLALIKQRHERPHPTEWIRFDKDLAKQDAKLDRYPDAVYEKTIRGLIESGLVSLRVVVGKKESIPCFRINKGDAK
jgi:hypothetical protein